MLDKTDDFSWPVYWSSFMMVKFSKQYVGSTDITFDCLFSHVQNEVSKFNFECTLVAQTYDGVSITSRQQSCLHHEIFEANSHAKLSACTEPCKEYNFFNFFLTAPFHHIQTKGFLS